MQKMDLFAMTEMRLILNVFKKIPEIKNFQASRKNWEDVLFPKKAFIPFTCKSNFNFQYKKIFTP